MKLVLSLVLLSGLTAFASCSKPPEEVKNNQLELSEEILPVIEATKEAKIQATLKTLGQLYFHIVKYEGQHKRLPRASGPGFVWELFKRGEIDKETAKTIFFDSFHRKEFSREENLNIDQIDFTGRRADREFRIGRIASRGASNTILVSQRVRGYRDPCDGGGICVLYASGRTEFIAKKQFVDGKIQIGPDSSIKELIPMQPN